MVAPLTLCTQLPWPARFAPTRKLGQAAVGSTTARISPGFCKFQECSAATCYKRTIPTRRGAHAPLRSLLFVPAVCFTDACQADADRAFVLAIVLPLLAAAAAAAVVLRPPPASSLQSGEIIEDPDSGALFTASPLASVASSQDGEEPTENEGADAIAEPERDAAGLLAFRAVSYTPHPVPRGYEGERCRVDVGPIAERRPRTYVFSKLLAQPSEILLVTLPRPMGVVFEYDKARKRAVVAGVVEGSAAAQRRRVAGLNPALAASSVQDGDVLRGVTCTNFVYQTTALIGAKAPQRTIVMYGADRQSWSSVRGALRKGEAKDGAVTLVLERRIAS